MTITYDELGEPVAYAGPVAARGRQHLFLGRVGTAASRRSLCGRLRSGAWPIARVPLTISEGWDLGSEGCDRCATFWDRVRVREAGYAID